MTPESRASIRAVFRQYKRIDDVSVDGVPMVGGRPARLSPRDRLFVAFLAEALLRFVGAGEASLVDQLDDLAKAKITKKRIKEFEAWHVALQVMVDDYNEALERYRAADAVATANAGAT